jgi:hypothetical protein
MFHRSSTPPSMSTLKDTGLKSIPIHWRKPQIVTMGKGAWIFSPPMLPGCVFSRFNLPLEASHFPGRPYSRPKLIRSLPPGSSLYYDPSHPVHGPSIRSLMHIKDIKKALPSATLTGILMHERCAYAKILIPFPLQRVSHPWYAGDGGDFTAARRTSRTGDAG